MIGEQIAAWREKLGLTQEEAAVMSGVPRKQYWKLENDKLVTIETFRRIVTALKPPMLTFGETTVVTDDLDITTLRNQAAETAASLRKLVALIDVLTATAGARAQAPSRPSHGAAAGRSTAKISMDDPIVQKLLELIAARDLADQPQNR